MKRSIRIFFYSRRSIHFFIESQSQYMYIAIRFTHLDYIGLYYRILIEILECDYIRSFFSLSLSRYPSFTWL